MRHITTVIFDLDDTLWDLPQVITHAESTLYEWFSAHYPEVNRRFSQSELRSLREAIGLEFPAMGHDLMFLREQTYRRIAEQCGYDASLSTDAFSVFQTARNEVVLYPDVEGVLKALTKTHRLFALSNGNADLGEIGLSKYFIGTYSARDLGCAKPDPTTFTMVCEHAGVVPDEVLHVGDDPYNDVAAPLRVGMHSVWVNRGAKPWPDDLDAPDYEISDLTPLTVMLGS